MEMAFFMDWSLSGLVVGLPQKKLRESCVCRRWLAGARQHPALDPSDRAIHLLAMTTTISVQAKGQLALPKEFCARKRLKAGTAVRVTEVGGGLYLTPIPEPTEAELKQVIAAAGSLLRPQTAEEEEMVEQEVAAYRAERRRKA